MNKKFDSRINPDLSAVVDKIEAKLECSRFRSFSDLIDIDTWQNIQGKMQRNRNVAENGFGFCISNYFDYGDLTFKRLIVINMENCHRLDFSEREIAAVVYHELGHLLNYPEPSIEPTFLYCFEHGIHYDKKLHDDIRNNNSMQDELFADSYANQFGYGVELLSTFYKQNGHFDQKIGYFEMRVETIKNNQLLIGDVKPIDTEGWFN